MSIVFYNILICFFAHTTRYCGMPDKINKNRGLDVVFLTTTSLRSRLRHRVLTRSRALSLSKNTPSDSHTTKFVDIFDDFWEKRTQLYFMLYYKRAFAEKHGNCDNLARFVLFLSGINQSHEFQFYRLFRRKSAIFLPFLPLSTREVSRQSNHRCP